MNDLRSGRAPQDTPLHAAATRVLGRPPLESQLQAVDLLRAGKAVIARLPTGSGKTLLGVLPFALGALPQRQMVFATPLRSLCSAQAAALRDAIDPDEARRELGAPWRVTEQTGAVPEDPLFTASAVVCTFDQALSSALRIAYSTSPGQRTINAGALLSAYWVADEIHLYPRDKALTTLLWLLRNRPPGLPFLLMTATMSDAIAGELGVLLGAALAPPLTERDRATLGIADRTRHVRWQARPFDGAQVAEACRSGLTRVLVVVNTVRRAIALAREVEEELAGAGVDVVVLHSLFYAHDRQAIEAEVRRRLGRSHQEERPIVLVGTQVVEVGLDVSADLLFVELAPANALVQRWGRCARWGGKGEVVVAPPPDAERGVLPYSREAGQDVVIDRTRRWLEERASELLPMRDEEERALVETVHGESDQAWLETLRRELAARGRRIGQVAAAGEYSAAGELIRHVETRTVLVHGDPEEIPRPMGMEGFNLPLGTMLRVLADEHGGAPEDEEFFGIADDIRVPWRIKVPIWPTDERPAREAGVVAGWATASRDDVRRAPLMVLHPRLATYDPRRGLSLQDGGGTSREHWSTPLKRAQRPLAARGGYRRETLAQHVERMMIVLRERDMLWPRTQPLADLFDEWADWPPGTLEEVTRAALVLHDVGKLAGAWQRHIDAYQTAHGMPVERWLVHSDDPPPEVVRRAWRPPPHALAGAAHSILLGRCLDEQVHRWRAERERYELWGAVYPSRVLFHAVATHHAPSPQTWAIGEGEQLDAEALAEVRRLLTVYDLPERVVGAPVGRPLSDLRVDESNAQLGGNARESVLLALVVRLLRLADQWSQEPATEH